MVRSLYSQEDRAWLWTPALWLVLRCFLTPGLARAYPVIQALGFDFPQKEFSLSIQSTLLVDTLAALLKS